MELSNLKFDANGLIPAIVVDAETDKVLTLAYMNEESLKLSMEKAVVNIKNHGNTSSASIPIALDEAVRSGEIKRGDKICLVGFGAGLTYAAAILEY